MTFIEFPCKWMVGTSPRISRGARKLTRTRGIVSIWSYIYRGQRKCHIKLNTVYFFSLKKRKTPFMSVEFAIEDWIGIAEPMVDWLLDTINSKIGILFG